MALDGLGAKLRPEPLSAARTPADSKESWSGLGRGWGLAAAVAAAAAAGMATSAGTSASCCDCARFASAFCAAVDGFEDAAGEMRVRLGVRADVCLDEARAFGVWIDDVGVVRGDKLDAGPKRKEPSALEPRASRPRLVDKEESVATVAVLGVDERGVRRHAVAFEHRIAKGGNRHAHVATEGEAAAREAVEEGCRVARADEALARDGREGARLVERAPLRRQQELGADKGLFGVVAVAPAREPDADAPSPMQQRCSPRATSGHGGRRRRRPCRRPRARAWGCSTARRDRRRAAACGGWWLRKLNMGWSFRYSERLLLLGVKLVGVGALRRLEQRGSAAGFEVDGRAGH